MRPKFGLGIDPEALTAPSALPGQNFNPGSPAEQALRRMKDRANAAGADAVKRQQENYVSREEQDSRAASANERDLGASMLESAAMFGSIGGKTASAAPVRALADSFNKRDEDNLARREKMRAAGQFDENAALKQMLELDNQGFEQAKRPMIMDKLRLDNETGQLSLNLDRDTYQDKVGKFSADRGLADSKLNVSKATEGSDIRQAGANVDLTRAKIEDMEQRRLLDAEANRTKAGAVKPSRELSDGTKQKITYLNSIDTSLEKMISEVEKEVKAATNPNALQPLGGRRFQLIGDNEFTKNMRLGAENFGRMQSGGAISKDEEAKFNDILRSYADSPTEALKRLKELQADMQSRRQVYRGGNDTYVSPLFEGGAKSAETSTGSKPGVKSVLSVDELP